LYDGSYLYLLSLISFTIIPWLSSRFGKLEHIEGKQSFGKQFLVSKVLTRFTNWITEILNWCLNHYIKTILVVWCFSFLFYGLVGGGLGGEFFAASDSGWFVQIELPKDASLEQTNFMTQKQKLS
jgi:HAE1 family hydrophobic/amphiphilic exporter-1